MLPPEPPLGLVDLTAEAGATGAAVRNVTVLAAASGTPLADRAAVETDIVTTLPLARGALGVKTRTVFFSAQAVLPARALVPIIARKAAPVVAGSIAWVKRTDRTCRSGTAVVPLSGRKRTTWGGAAAVT